MRGHRRWCSSRGCRQLQGIQDVHRQPHSKLREPEIGIDLSAANSWLLRSPGILSRRALRGFFPLRRRLLDQPSPRMRNPSHQLNAGYGAKDMPDRKRGAPGRAFLREMSFDRMSYAAKCMAMAEETALSAWFDVARTIRSMLRDIAQADQSRWLMCFRLPLLRQGAQILVVRLLSDCTIDRYHRARGFIEILILRCSNKLLDRIRDNRCRR
jgi:hypothetical protein